MPFSYMHATLHAFNKAFPNPAWPLLNFIRDSVQHSLERFGPVLPVYGNRVLGLTDLEKKILRMCAQLSRRMPKEAYNIEAAAMAALDGALLPWYRASSAVEYEVKEFSPRNSAAIFQNPSRSALARNRYPVARR